SVSDGESYAGSFSRRIAAGNDSSGRRTRGDARIQRSLFGTARIEVAHADHAGRDRSISSAGTQRNDFYRRTRALAFRIRRRGGEWTRDSARGRSGGRRGADGRCERRDGHGGSQAADFLI